MLRDGVAGGGGRLMGRCRIWVAMVAWLASGPAVAGKKADLEAALASEQARARALDQEVADLRARLLRLEVELSVQESRLAGLEARTESLEGHTAEEGRPPGPTLAGHREEVAAATLYELADAAVAAHDMARARQLLAELDSLYGGTATARRAKRLQRELSVVGTTVDELAVEFWFGEEARIGDAPVTVLVFWEQWCPHCRRDLPQFNDVLARYGEAGLQVIGLTRLTRGATREKAAAFIDTHALAFPNAMETGAVSKQLQVTGIPAAAVVVGGQVVWRGHPARLEDGLIESHLP